MRYSTIAMTLDGYGRGIPEANRKAILRSGEWCGAMNPLNRRWRALCFLELVRKGDLNYSITLITRNLLILHSA